MVSLILKRFAGIIVTAFFVVTLTFFIFRFVPGDVARIIAGERATESEVAAIREQMGLNDPIEEQYLRYMGGLLQGDLGRSLAFRGKVLDEIIKRIPATLELAITSTVISAVLGVLTGLISAIKRNSFFDYFSMVFAIGGICIPNFWLGLLLIIFFSVGLGWFPTGGRGGIIFLILPTITLAARLIAVIARLTRSTMLDIVSQDYIRTARGKGLTEWVVISRHALRNALIPIITIVGLQFGSLLAGSIVVETVFAWPGMGSLLIDAVNTRDYPMVQGITLTYTVMFMLVNFLTDISYGVLDPRVRVQQ